MDLRIEAPLPDKPAWLASSGTRRIASKLSEVELHLKGRHGISRAPTPTMIQEIGFALDSALEEAGFEPSVPLIIRELSGYTPSCSIRDERSAATMIQEIEFARLPAGAKWIRTLGPTLGIIVSRSLLSSRPVPLWESGNHHFANGEPKVRIHLPPGGSPLRT